MNTTSDNLAQALNDLAKQLEGECYTGELMRVLYATDASVYRELPMAVVLPKNKEDLKKLIAFAQAQQSSLIPRAAGTSLAGQCVGSGIVVDVSKHFNRILEVNIAEQWVRVEPGVIRDELNDFLRTHGYFFSPITSTANRAMIGGMVGNNSSGTSSIVYGSTRDHTLELEILLSDGSEMLVHATSPQKFKEKTQLNNFEGKLYQHIQEELSQPQQQENINTHFPKATIHRRNTGYAVDYLLDSEVFSEKSKRTFNFCDLLCGSEGTLALTTAIKLHVDPLPAPENVVLAAHFNTIRASLLATQIAMRHQPTACELMDKIILDCTKANIEQSKNRFFVEGDPQAILLVELRAQTAEGAREKAGELIKDLRQHNLGYTFPIIPKEKTQQTWALRSAGLGLLANLPGDAKAVACIEDTAVALEDLPDYIDEFTQIMEAFGQRSVYYAHAGAGEIHLRPILNLKRSEDVQQFYDISKASAQLVKKYQGSLSGEHGDGRVRAAFIPLMVGEENYALFQRIKQTWDPQHIFNPGKIVDAAPMNESLRYESDQSVREMDTLFDFSEVGGMLRAAEKCNGSGDCRKLSLSGGTMCPSYRATRNEKDSTRARANALREYLTKASPEALFDQPAIKEVLDLCLSCKACLSECPSNVDMASMKAEFLYQYQKIHGFSWRTRAFAAFSQLVSWGARLPRLSNALLQYSLTSRLFKTMLGIAPQRSIPPISSPSLRAWYQRYFSRLPKVTKPIKTIYLFCDEFTNFQDSTIGIKTVLLLHALQYEVKLIQHPESGRAAISKGMLKKAQKYAIENVRTFHPIIHSDSPLIGIEPSAILGFRDEYPRLVTAPWRAAAKALKTHCFLLDEFIHQEMMNGHIRKEQFDRQHRKMVLHGHCHQKALSSVETTAWVLSFPDNHHVEVIPSGCCGMAGSFGYEREHYTLSMQIGEMVLFPAIRKTDHTHYVLAPGTSCRHQIADGTGRRALHPAELLYEALKGTADI
ncbi:MAG: FAD-binding and (Fe-S)-binding domain-containing protein [Bacteroidota bacterium]